MPCSSPMVWAVSCWAYTTMPVVATIFAVSVLLQVRYYPTQLLFYAAQERMIAKYPLATNDGLGREQDMLESTKMMQDGSNLVEAS